MRTGKDPGLLAVLVEDNTALAGLTVALVGLTLAQLLDAPAWDGVASLGIGILLVGAPTFLARETLSLMSGESAARNVLDDVRRIFAADSRVESVEEVLSLQMGPESILPGVSIDFDDRLDSPAIETAVRELSSALSASQPRITRVFMRPVGA